MVLRQSPSCQPRSIPTGQSPDPLPCPLLGQLATDEQWLRKGIATDQRGVEGSTLSDCRALIVNSVDDEATEFRKWRGSLPSKVDPMALTRTVLDIAASLEASAIKGWPHNTSGLQNSDSCASSLATKVAGGPTITSSRPACRTMMPS